jgi:hypothetical protein
MPDLANLMPTKFFEEKHRSTDVQKLSCRVNVKKADMAETQFSLRPVPHDC